MLDARTKDLLIQAIVHQSTIKNKAALREALEEMAVSYATLDETNKAVSELVTLTAKAAATEAVNDAMRSGQLILAMVDNQKAGELN